MKTIKPRRPQTVKKQDRADVRNGRIEFGQMVDLGRVLDAKDLGDTEKFRRLIKVLHPDIEPAINLENVRYAVEIMHAVVFWREQENRRLHYEPSAEEKQAGFEKMAAAIGPRGVAVSMGKDFSRHPDEVFKWSYGSVFSILEVDLQRYEFTKRLNEIREKKREQQERNKRLTARRARHR